ncbi:histidine phosphatase family protein [Novosphingobium sp. BW1]|uniref:histidine phosphatase family protein n=1 Tax=Novosphingobium sp. BW1 TaxID=2592621 RepID=UPI0011DEF8DE|nr:histidine phosphatase family protein [Novosphingobium sp. BW1]TYC93286.1 histidine phosphatase family protein [Novosphingobium sp. BW1]
MFIIVRHGNTFEAGETPRRIGARTDLPLTAKGIAQAEALGAHFAALGLTFRRAFVSPLARTRQSAAAILSQQEGAPALPRNAEFLREIDHGPDEDATEDAIRARIGADARAAWDREAVVPPDWNVEPETRKAAWRVLFAQSKPDDGPTLLVTSNGAARFALLADPALAQAARALPTMKLPTGGYGLIAHGADGTLELREWGTRP